MENRDFLQARLTELSAKADTRDIATHTGFLSQSDRDLAVNFGKKLPIIPQFYGGYDEAERKIAVFLPEYIDMQDFKDRNIISALCATWYGDKQPGHRDFLGSLIALGLERRVIGDILIDKNTAFIFMLTDMARFASEQLNQVGSIAVKLNTLTCSEVALPERKTQLRRFTVASLRLDSVISGIFPISRTQAARMIESGLVRLRDSECKRPDASVAQGDVLSVRGVGKAVIFEVGGQSKKGRTFVDCHIYL